MTRITYLISGVCAASLGLGCNDLGDCTDAAKGRYPVLVGTQVMYAGQAIIATSCAAGSCHTELSSRANRYGAPAGLDFDIKPVVASGMTTTVDGREIAEISDEDLARLKKHQRKVFDSRHDIWEQVERGLMPPEGVGKPWREASAGQLIDVSGGGCTATGALAPITDKQTREILRGWLACGSPIVEANVTGLAQPVGGTVGDQFPACAPPGDPTFDNLYATVISPTCVNGCHEPGGSREQFDLSTPEIAFASLMGADGTGGVPSGCSTNKDPMVTPNKPEDSYFYAQVGGTGGSICSPVMPFGSVDGLEPASLDLVKRWIEAGAPAPGVAVGDAGVGDDAGAGDGGLDAGT
ncbi:MAG: hypothetical protein QM778_32160 [Myxococcales bacterium]